MYDEEDLEEDDLEWAGMYEALDPYVSADYIGKGAAIEEGTMVTARLIYRDVEDMDKTIRELMSKMFLGDEEFIVNFGNDIQTLNIHISWDNIVSFLEEYKEARKDLVFWIKAKLRE